MIDKLSQNLTTGVISEPVFVQTCLARISAAERDERPLGAVVWLHPDARSRALALKAEREAGRLRGPLHGIPFLAKDNMDVAGTPTCAGTRLLRDHRALATAEAIKRLEDAGAILLGKTNMSELALSFGRFGYSSAHGQTHNPTDLERHASGSSSGSAAAVAAGLVPFALGSDTSGSIRGPASVCGVVGVRPAVGAISTRGVFPLSGTLDCIGPICGSVADARLVCRALGIATPPEDRSDTPLAVVSPVPADDGGVATLFEGALDRLSQAFRLKIVSSDTLAKDLGALVADVVASEFPPAYDGVRTAYDPPLPTLDALAAAAAGTPCISKGHREWLAGVAGRTSVAISEPRAHLSGELAECLERSGAKALLFPTFARVADRIDAPASYGQDPYRMCYLGSVAGWPEITLPMGRSGDGLPAGLSVLTRREDSSLLFDIAQRIETTLGIDFSPAIGTTIASL